MTELIEPTENIDPIIATFAPDIDDDLLFETLRNLFPEGFPADNPEGSDPAVPSDFAVPCPSPAERQQPATCATVPDSRIGAVLDKGSRFQECSWQDLCWLFAALDRDLPHQRDLKAERVHNRLIPGLFMHDLEYSTEASRTAKTVLFGSPASGELEKYDDRAWVLIRHKEHKGSWKDSNLCGKMVTIVNPCTQQQCKNAPTIRRRKLSTKREIEGVMMYFLIQPKSVVQLFFKSLPQELVMPSGHKRKTMDFPVAEEDSVKKLKWFAEEIPYLLGCIQSEQQADKMIQLILDATQGSKQPTMRGPPTSIEITVQDRMLEDIWYALQGWLFESDGKDAADVDAFLRSSLLPLLVDASEDTAALKSEIADGSDPIQFLQSFVQAVAAKLEQQQAVRVLVVLNASAEHLNLEHEHALIAGCMHEGWGSNCTIDSMIGRTADEVLDRLIDTAYDYIHIGAHGEAGTITFADGKKALDGLLDRFVANRQRFHTLRAVILNCCGAGIRNEIFQPVQNAGVSVVAARGLISDKSYLEYSKGFYAVVAQLRDPNVQAAHQEALARIKTHVLESERADHGTLPELYQARPSHDLALEQQLSQAVETIEKLRLAEGDANAAFEAASLSAEELDQKAQEALVLADHAKEVAETQRVAFTEAQAATEAARQSLACLEARKAAAHIGEDVAEQCAESTADQNGASPGNHLPNYRQAFKERIEDEYRWHVQRYVVTNGLETPHLLQNAFWLVSLPGDKHRWFSSDWFLNKKENVAAAALQVIEQVGNTESTEIPLSVSEMFELLLDKCRENVDFVVFLQSQAGNKTGEIVTQHNSESAPIDAPNLSPGSTKLKLNNYLQKHKLPGATYKCRPDSNVANSTGRFACDVTITDGARGLRTFSSHDGHPKMKQAEEDAARVALDYLMPEFGRVREQMHQRGWQVVDTRDEGETGFLSVWGVTTSCGCSTLFSSTRCPSEKEANECVAQIAWRRLGQLNE